MGSLLFPKLSNYHKLYAPKEIGALIIRKGYYLKPLMFGGGHQQGMRSGTLNVPGIVGLGEACRLRQLEMADNERGIARKRDRLQALPLEKIPNLIINGDIDSRLAGNLHISIPGIPNSAVIAKVRSQLAYFHRLGLFVWRRGSFSCVEGDRLITGSNRGSVADWDR